MKTFAKSLYVLWFYKHGTQNLSADVFLRLCFYLVLYGQVLENLGKLGRNLAKNGVWAKILRTPKDLPAPTPMI